MYNTLILKRFEKFDFSLPPAQPHPQKIEFFKFFKIKVLYMPPIANLMLKPNIALKMS